MRPRELHADQRRRKDRRGDGKRPKEVATTSVFDASVPSPINAVFAQDEKLEAIDLSAGREVEEEDSAS